MKLALQHIKISSVITTLIGSGLLFLCGQVSIPLQPVPITLQTVAMLVIGLTFSKADALRSVISYLTLGALGLPIFANFSGGFAKIMGPAGGYYFGFLAAVWMMCTLRERFSNSNMILVAIAGQITLYTCGASWLSTFIGFDKAITFGVLTFIIPGLIKSVLVALAVRYIKK